jgi:hypothetical protein
VPAIWETWKDRFFERLVDLRLRFEQDKSGMVYTALCAVALSPLLQAARSEGILPVAQALLNVAAGVGGNLIAEQIQRWKDQSDSSSETQIAAWIESQAATNAGLRQAMDAILEHLEAIQRARQGLSKNTRQWFVQTLRHELQGMGNLARFEAHLTGAGAIAQGTGAVAVGGNVYGDIYTGPPTRDLAEALRIYRQVLWESCRHVSHHGLDIKAGNPTSRQQRFDLSQVYVELLTTTQVPQDEPSTPCRQRQDRLAERHTRPLSALEAIVNHCCLVLLGDPGSGKSTCLNYLTLCLTAHALEPAQQWLARLRQWPQKEADIVPVPVVLRDFAQWLPVEEKKAVPSHLWHFIQERLEQQNLAFATDALHDQLEQGRAMLLLDGLDEIPTPRQRVFVRDAVTMDERTWRHPMKWPACCAAAPSGPVVRACAAPIAAGTTCGTSATSWGFALWWCAHRFTLKL